jgi:hypothetical protein
MAVVVVVAAVKAAAVPSLSLPQLSQLVWQLLPTELLLLFVRQKQLILRLL